MKEYLSSLEEVLKEQNSSQEGLTTGEAQERLSKYGKNELEKGKKTSLIQRFLKELADPMIPAFSEGTGRSYDHYSDRSCHYIWNHCFL